MADVEKKGGAAVVRLAGRTPCGSEDIVAGLLQKNPEAASALYEQFGQRINRLVWRMLGADQEHDDVVQQVFVNILKSVEKLRNPAVLGAWVAGITVNTVRREIRSRKIRRVLLLAGGHPRCGVDHPDPEKRLLVRRFFGVIDGMRTEDRIVLVLRFVEGNTLGEVAGACRCSLATAKRRIARAKKAFYKKALEDPELARLVEEMSHEERHEDAGTNRK